MKQQTIAYKVFRFYYDGFRSMQLGRKLWAIILIKLFIMFVVFRIFFFKDFLNERFNSKEEKSDYVIEQLTPQPKY